MKTQDAAGTPAAETHASIELPRRLHVADLVGEDEAVEQVESLRELGVGSKLAWRRLVFEPR